MCRPAMYAEECGGGGARADQGPESANWGTGSAVSPGPAADSGARGELRRAAQMHAPVPSSNAFARWRMAEAGVAGCETAARLL